MLPQRSIAVQPPTTGVPVRDILRRVCVRPPYFALADLAFGGRVLDATARAEAPPYGELGPMTAADLGRHAAILGLTHVAASQRDDARRYYLAQRAECVYVAGSQPHGTPVRLASEVVEHTKRACRVHVEATALDLPLASFDLWYAILPESAFCRLFRSRARETPSGPSPYGRLLETEFERGQDWAEQVVDPLSASACRGHFDGYPALPVAVLMGQLSYLAGRLAVDGADSYRVVRGSIDATDLAWAGERARFRVERDGVEGSVQRFACSVDAADRQVGTMTLWLELVGVPDGTV